MQPAPHASCAQDFDFLIGHWAVRHRKLQQRLRGCTEWDTFNGTSQVAPLMGGQGNVDDNWLDLPSGPYRAVSLRAFDPASRRWSIWWLDGRHPDTLDAPVRGGFVDGEGSFYANDQFEGQPIRVRFLWSDITTNSARWQQAFSMDGGASWETNWVMEFERVA